MRLRVTSTGIPGGGETKVVNAETGEPLRNVTSVRWIHDDVREFPRLVIELNDAEIDAEIESSCTVVHTPAPDQPRLLLHSPRPLSPQMRRNIQDALNCSRGNLIPVTTIEQMSVYQLVDGRWLPLDTSTAPVPDETLERDGITADSD